MTDKEILQKAILKAKENSSMSNAELNLMSVASEIDFWDNKYHTLIFSHDFAKAFWGEENFHWSLSDEFYVDNEIVANNVAELQSSKYQLSDKELKNLEERNEGWFDTAIGDYVYRRNICGVNKDWKFHLSKMVLEKEPLKYLEKFL